MIANTFEVGKHFGIKDACFVGAAAGMHTLDLVQAEFFGKIIDFLFELGDLPQLVFIQRIQLAQQVEGFEALGAEVNVEGGYVALPHEQYQNQ